MSNSSDAATFASLPVELKIAIIEELYEPSHWSENAAWAKPYRSIYSREGEWELATVETPEGTSNDIICTISRGSSLRRLRHVSKELDALCAPFLHRELEIYDALTPRSSDTPACSVNPEHVRSIKIHLGTDPTSTRLYVSSARSHQSPDQQSSVADILGAMVHVLSQCTNVTKLAIYYSSGQYLAEATILIEQLVRMLEGGSIRYLGIYSTVFMGSIRYIPAWDSEVVPITLVQVLFGGRDRCNSLRRVELVMNKIEHKEYELVQQNLSFVQSLTILRAHRRYHGAVDRSFGVSNWAANQHLTRLHLAHCEPAHVQHMLDIVRNFPLLEELLWDISGHYSDRQLPAPEPGWSKESNALHLIRKPLRILHLEHAIEWELAILAQIPTVELVVAHYEVYRITNVLQSTRESFIGMQVLRVSPLVGHDAVDEEVISALKEECLAREVTLFCHAEIHFPCSCCYNPV